MNLGNILCSQSGSFWKFVAYSILGLLIIFCWAMKLLTIKMCKDKQRELNINLPSIVHVDFSPLLNGESLLNRIYWNT